MPSIVPPGYTRGPILYINPTEQTNANEPLLQMFWEQAGGYGARIAVIALGHPAQALGERIHAQYAAWDTASVTTTTLAGREQAMQVDPGSAIAEATGILLVTTATVSGATLLGGTDLAQLIRRKNAQNTAVCGLGDGGMVICQHMTRLRGSDADECAFLPGLGLINRLTVLPYPGELEVTGDEWSRRAVQLAWIVAHNPFLIGVGVPQGSGIVIYPDSTLQRFGAGQTLILHDRDLPVDSWDADGVPVRPASAAGVLLHGDQSFNMDSRAITRAVDVDDTPGESHSSSAF